MTSQTPDIIGLVKDTQKSHDSIMAGSDLTEVAMGDMLHLWHNFPAIAQALLQREEALEQRDDLLRKSGEMLIYLQSYVTNERTKVRMQKIINSINTIL